jgi:hypothetical protein
MESIDKRDARTLFLNYVTGRLSTTEQEGVESRLLMDQQFSDTMAVHEQEHIDAYATGSFTAEELAQLRPWIEGSAARMQRVAIARSFLRQSRRIDRPLKAKLLALALAACLLLAAGLVVSRNRWISRPSTPANISKSAPAADGDQSASPRAGKADVILLIAERIRGTQEQRPTFFVKAGNPIKVEILLATDAGSQYGLKIVREGTSPQTILETSNLEPQLADRHPYLVATLRPGSVPPGTYKVLLIHAGDTQMMRFEVKWLTPS